MYSVFFDGSCYPVNPCGYGHIGTIVKRDGEVVAQFSESLPCGPNMSNNVAEYEALSKGLQYLIDNGCQLQRVRALGDSLIVVSRMSKKELSGGICREASIRCLALVYQFKNLTIQWIPREQNKQADALTRLNRKSFKRIQSPS